MCGLVGMMGDLRREHKNALMDMIHMDTLRGQDSTGLAVVRRNNSMDMYKSTVPGSEFVTHSKAENLPNLSDRLWLAHNRFKTVGVASRANAHPFVVFNDKEEYTLIGAHNGTLENKHEIDKDRHYGTDSEALMVLINEVGVEEAIKQVKGAWAISWYDSIEMTMNFIRNDKRPLFYGYTKDNKVMVWASEPWMIRAAMWRNGIELENDGTVYSFNADTWYAFDSPDNGTASIEKPATKGGVCGKPETSNFHSSWVGSSYGTNWKKDDEKGKTSATSSSKTLLVGEVYGFRGEPVQRSKVDRLKKEGCSWCDEVIPDDKPIAWLDANSLVCTRCVNGTHYLFDKQGKLVLTPEQEDKLREVRDAKIAREEARKQAEAQTG